MKYGLALDCIFRQCEAFRDGSNLEQVFGFLRSIDVRTVEINAFKRFEFDDEIYEKKLRFLGKLQDMSVTLHNGAHELCSLDEDERLATVRRICAEIELNARFFQPELIVLHPGPPTATEEQRRERYARLRESTLPILECCERHGVKIVYENMRHQYPLPDYPSLIALLGEEEFQRVLKEEPLRAFPRVGGLISRLLEFVRSFGTEMIGLCIDTGHTNISEGEALPEKIRESGPTLYHVHTSDNFGINDNHLPPGSADIDWQAVYAALEEIGYPGAVLLEMTAKFEDPGDYTTENILAIVRADHDHYCARGARELSLDEESGRTCKRLRAEGPR